MPFGMGTSHGVGVLALLPVFVLQPGRSLEHSSSVMLRGGYSAAPWLKRRVCFDPLFAEAQASASGRIWRQKSMLPASRVPGAGGRTLPRRRRAPAGHALRPACRGRRKELEALVANSRPWPELGTDGPIALVRNDPLTSPQMGKKKKVCCICLACSLLICCIGFACLPAIGPHTFCDAVVSSFKNRFVAPQVWKKEPLHTLPPTLLQCPQHEVGGFVVCPALKANLESS